jgi:hypothetical protein
LKGKRGEQLLAAYLRARFPTLAFRRGWQSRQGDDDPDVVGLPGVWLESKCGACPNPRRALAQATADAAGRAIPVAVIRDDRRPPFVVLSLDHFARIMGAAYGIEPALVTEAAE